MVVFLSIQIKCLLEIEIIQSTKQIKMVWLIYMSYIETQQPLRGATTEQTGHIYLAQYAHSNVEHGRSIPKSQ